MLMETSITLDSCLIETPLIISAAAKVLFLLSFGSFWTIIALILKTSHDIPV